MARDKVYPHDCQVGKIISCYVCFFIETVQRNEDKAKLIAVEQTCRQDQMKMAARLAAIEKSHGENQAMHSQQIQKLQTQNASLQDENRKVARKTEEVDSQLQRGEFCYLLE